MENMHMPASNAPLSADQTHDYKNMRRAMIDSQLRPNAVEDRWVLQAIAQVAREDYVPDQYRNIAYMDRSISMGDSRYLAPALTSALMIQKADIQLDDHILIIGSGSGYNAQIASLRAQTVIALENDIENRAAAPNITTVQGPLNQGAPDHAPYSLIIIEGAVEQIPQMIVDQLADGGRLICGLMEGAVSHLSVGYKRGDALAMVAFMECELEKFGPEHGFDKEKEFSF